MVTMCVRIDPELKRDAEICLDKLGLSMSSAINIYLRQVVRLNGIPFRLDCGEGRTEKPRPSTDSAETTGKARPRDKKAGLISSVGFSLRNTLKK